MATAKQLKSMRERFCEIQKERSYSSAQTSYYLGVKPNTLEHWRANKTRAQPAYIQEKDNSAVCYLGSELIRFISSELGDENNSSEFNAREMLFINKLRKLLIDAPRDIRISLKEDNLVFVKGESQETLTTLN